MTGTTSDRNDPELEDVGTPEMPFPGETECGCDPRSGELCDRHGRPWWRRILR